MATSEIVFRCAMDSLSGCLVTDVQSHSRIKPDVDLTCAGRVHQLNIRVQYSGHRPQPRAFREDSLADKSAELFYSTPRPSYPGLLLEHPPKPHDEHEVGTCQDTGHRELVPQWLAPRRLGLWTTVRPTSLMSFRPVYVRKITSTRE